MQLTRLRVTDTRSFAIRLAPHLSELEVLAHDFGTVGNIRSRLEFGSYAAQLGIGHGVK